MLSSMQTLIDVVYMVLLGGVVIGGIFAFRHGSTKETQDAMERLNKALDGEVASLHRRVDDLERDRATQDRVIATIRSLLKSQGWRVIISGDVVTIQELSGKSRSAAIYDKAVIKSIVPTEDDDDTAS